MNLFRKKQNFQIGFDLNVGYKRYGKPNQDSIRVTLPGWFNHRPPLLVLSDGMGGYGGGEVASKIAVETLTQNYRRSDPQNTDYPALLTESIKEAHQAITKRAHKSRKLEWMGCTVVTAVLLEDMIHLANVGDSRAYRINRNEITQISLDHSLVAEQLRLGLITEEEAKTHPKRNVLSLSLTGRRESAPPFVASEPWQPGDTLLLCSDGLWGPISELQMKSIVLELPIQAAAEKLVKLANIRGGPDNISVILAQHAGVKPLTFDELDQTNESVQIADDES